VNRGERLIKFRDSWFSMKSIEVESLCLCINSSRALDREVLLEDKITLTKLRKLFNFLKGIRLRAIRFVVERERAQKNS